MLNSVIDLKTLKIHVCMFTWQCYGFSWWVLTGSLRLDRDEHFCVVLLFIIFWVQLLGSLLAPSSTHIGFNPRHLEREKLIKTFFGIYLIMYKLFRSKINPQFLRLEKRKDELKFNFWMPGSLNCAPHHHPNLSLCQCHFLAGWTTEAGGLGYVHVK